MLHWRLDARCSTSSVPHRTRAGQKVDNTRPWSSNRRRSLGPRKARSETYSGDPHPISRRSLKSSLSTAISVIKIAYNLLILKENKNDFWIDQQPERREDTPDRVPQSRQSGAPNLARKSQLDQWVRLTCRR